MDIRKLQRAIVDGLEDVKAQAIAVFNTEALSPLFERVIVATGASNRQTKALAASVRDTVRERGLPVMRIEGEENGEWIIVDCGAAVVHIMQPAIREYYHLEEIWGGKPVKMKLAATTGATRLVKASEDLPDGAAAAAARAAAPRKAAAGAKAKAPARAASPSSARSATKASGPAAAKPRAPARRPAGAAKAKAPVRTVVAGKPAAKSRAARPAAGRAGAAAKRRA